MTDHDRVRDLIPAYALHALDEDEVNLVKAHLGSCALCQEELRKYEESALELADLVPLRTPPAHLKSALMDRIRAETPSTSEAVPGVSLWERARSLFQTSPPVWVPVSAIGVLVLMLTGIVMWRQANPPEPPQILTVVLSHTEAAPDASGILTFTEGEQGGTLTVSNLEPLSEEEQYQLWLINEDGSRDSGAVFSVDPSGQAEVTVSGSKALPEYSTFGITVEPAGGSPLPTGVKVLGSEA